MGKQQCDGAPHREDGTKKAQERLIKQVKAKRVVKRKAKGFEESFYQDFNPDNPKAGFKRMKIMDNQCIGEMVSGFILSMDQLMQRWPSVANKIKNCLHKERVQEDIYINVSDVPSEDKVERNVGWSPEVVGDMRENFYLRVVRVS